MSAKSTKGKNSAKIIATPPPQAAWWQWRMWLCAVGIGAAIVAAICLPRFLPDLKGQADYQFRMDEMRISPPPAWVPPTLLSQVLQASHFPETVSLLEPKLCEQLAHAWQQNPWVKQVHSVQITRDATVQVDVEYRVPVAFVEVPRGLYPIDGDGVLLPPADFSNSDLDRLPHLRGVKSLPQGGIGVHWGDPVVTAAAQLIAVLVPDQNLETYWKRFGFAVLVAPDIVPAGASPDQLVFEIQTIGGSRILWGKAPGADKLEPTTDVKLARLQDYISRFGGLEGTAGPQLIDIRPFRGIAVDPLRQQPYR